MQLARTAILFATACMFVLGPASMSYADDRRTVTVSASGTATAEPDAAEITTGVLSDAPTARDALNRNSADMQKLIDALKGLGIEPKDIRTVAFQVDPQYTGNREGKAPTLTGYRVSNQVRIVVRDLKRLGEILDRAIAAGANHAGGISFVVSREEELRDAARRDAMANALRRAKLYAEAARSELGKVVTITEEGGFVSPRPVAAGRMAMSSVPIEAGTQALDVRVSVTFELKN
jgi:uncharacterized protein YggE